MNPNVLVIANFGKVKTEKMIKMRKTRLDTMVSEAQVNRSQTKILIHGTLFYPFIPHFFHPF